MISNEQNSKEKEDEGMDDAGFMPEATSPQTARADTQEDRQVLIRVNDREMSRSYANAYRSNTTPEEVILDFGLNLAIPPTGDSQSGQKSETEGHILFQVDHRIIMNYYTAKRLAITLGQVVRLYEDRFGELKLTSRGGGASDAS